MCAQQAVAEEALDLQSSLSVNKSQLFEYFVVIVLVHRGQSAGSDVKRRCPLAMEHHAKRTKRLCRLSEATLSKAGQRICDVCSDIARNENENLKSQGCAERGTGLFTSRLMRRRLD